MAAIAPTAAAAAQSLFPWPHFFRHVYAAKFLCGGLKPGRAAASEGPVEPGSYSTAINVHNPHGFRVGLRKKAILLYDARHPEQAVERPTPPVRRECPVLKELSPDWGRDRLPRHPRGPARRCVGTGRPAGSDLHQGLGRDRDARGRATRRRRRLHGRAAGTDGMQPVSIATERIAGRRVFLPGF